MAINFSVRLDDDTERKLNELVEHFRATPTIGTVRKSDVVRVAIEHLHRDTRAGERLGEITTEQIEAARRDPRVIGLHAKADQHLAELRKTGDR